MKFCRVSRYLTHFFKSCYPLKQTQDLPIRTDWSKYLKTLMQDQVDDILKQFQVQWIKEQCILKQKLICTDDIDFTIPTIDMTLRDPDHPIVQCIDNTIQFIINHDNRKHNEEQKHNTLKYIGGVDISHGSIDEDVACAGLVVLEYPSLNEVYRKFKMVRYNKPYIAGFLAFREVDFLLEIIAEMKQEKNAFVPQIILVDGNGVLHHRGFGLASHLGVLCGIPTIGIGKNLLMIDGLDRKIVKKKCDKCLSKKGDYMQLIGNTKDVIHGVALRCGVKGKNAMFVSIGHRISLESCIKIVLLVSIHKLPEPIRFADLGTREFMRNYENELQKNHKDEPERPETASTSKST